MNSISLLRIVIYLVLGISSVAPRPAAASCIEQTADGVLSRFDTVFVALVTEGYLLESDDDNRCGSIEGSFEVVEELKGNPTSLTSLIRMPSKNCNGTHSGNFSDQYPLGKYILAKTSDDMIYFGGCWSRSWNPGEEPGCLVDDIRRRLDIAPPSSELREHCIAREEQRRLERESYEMHKINSLRNNIKYLEDRIAESQAELERYRESLAEAEAEADW